MNFIRIICEPSNIGLSSKRIVTISNGGCFVLILKHDIASKKKPDIEMPLRDNYCFRIITTTK